MTAVQRDLFSVETKPLARPKSRAETFGNYDEFVEKFKPKKTTDDCYTPAAVYDCVVEWVREQVDISGCKILRPFYPGGDYQAEEYPAGSVVIDNPPFSIISQISRFYIERGIKFFLFAPHLTLFGSDLDCTAVVCGAAIEYANGAVVNTSFLTNMLPDHIRVIGAPDLYRRLKDIQDANAVNLPKYEYPDNVLTVSMVEKCVKRGIVMQFSKESVRHCRGLDSQKLRKKAIFGSGFLLSEKAAAEKAAAEKAAAEKAAAEKAAAEKESVIIWDISDREREIIKSLK